MSENVQPMDNEELEDGMVPVFTLMDEEGNEEDFELLAEAEIDGKLYYALAAANEETEEYVILSVTEEGDELFLETIEDDDEFEKVEDYFNDLFMSEIDYDNQ